MSQRGARNSVTRSAQRSPRGRWVGWLAGGLSVALIATLAVIADGFDSRETPREDPSVWVERSGAQQYARVNTETAEIDTVRSAASPSEFLQTGDLALLLTQGLARAWSIDPSSPQDVREDSDASDSGEDQPGEAGVDVAASVDAASDADADTVASDTSGAETRTPDGTRQIIATDQVVLFGTQSGEAYFSEVIPGSAGTATTLGAAAKLDPFAEERAVQEQGGEAAESEIEQYFADAVAVDDDGLVALYSHAEQAVRWYDTSNGSWRGGPSEVPADIQAEDVQLAIVGGEWVLFDTVDGRLWREGGREAVTLDTVGSALLQASTTTGSDVLVADEAGLWRVAQDGSAERIVSAAGVTAQPRFADGEAVAAWISSSEALMWTESGGERVLELDPAVEDLSEPKTEIRTNGDRALVLEHGSGMMWTVPDGKLIPVEQWSLVDPPKQQSGTVVKQDVTEQEPPVAQDDVFGVRAGEPALLPVLLNDYDPNSKDVLTVVSEKLGDGLDESFATLTTSSDGQAVLIQPSASARGSTTFSYRITDGVNVSEPATVTVKVADESVNTAPKWCAVEGCQRSWPSPQIEPGGTLIMPVLESWVDAEGDPMMLESATVVNSEEPIRALVTADGRLAIRHSDENAAGANVTVKLKVVDARGEATEKNLNVQVRSGAAISFTGTAATAKVDEPLVLQPLERVTGGSGSFQLVDAAVQQGSLSATVNQGLGTIEVSAHTPGNALLGVTVRDTVTASEVTGVIRVTAVDQRPAFGVPPLRAFLRPFADSTVDVLAAIPGSSSRALAVQSATVVDGQLRADVIEHSRVRVSGSTEDGQPGRIGSADVVIAEGDAVATTRLTVFQVAENSGAGAIAVADTATVRAGSVVDIRVLDNDVSAPGERLVLHPNVSSSSGEEDELAFASGSSVRYLAPKKAGTYRLSYTTYGASSPEQSDVGQVVVTVLPQGSNRNPQPAMVTVRVAPGEETNATVPLSGVDPDGDRVRLVSVAAPTDPQLSATILPRSSSLQIAASSVATRGVRTVEYTVRDAYGGEASGVLRIIVTDPDPGGGAPVVYSDYVRLARGAVDPAVVRPLDNDIDPSGGTLELVSVVPNVPGGESAPEYKQLLGRLDLSKLDQGIVSVRGDEVGTALYKYTARSPKTKSTSEGLIVVQVSERIGQQAPAVTDTVLSVRDRADLESVGVDVVTNRVRWSGGDASTLKLSLWGKAAGSYRVSGSKIIGKYLAEGDLVPFRLAGTDMTGAEIQTFGFLVVPPLDELRLSLKPGVVASSVNENESVDIRVEELLDLGSSDRIELDQGPFSVQRQQASCTVVNGTTVRYSAGREAPWTDSCSIRVRLTEQNVYTLLALPINIVPDEPVAQLNPMTRTISPGATETVNLAEMVQWQGGREGNVAQLQWQVSGGGSSFTVSTQGSQLQAVAAANAVPGAQEAISISVRGSGESQAVLTLRVGEAVADNPRGGTVSLQCVVGSSCATKLIGAQGQYDPFAGKAGGGLQLVSIDGAGCRYGQLSAVGDAVQVSWADSGGPGGKCTASFTVRDAQNRTGTGTIELDARGVPRAPSSVSATGADATSVTLTVQLSGETSYPAVTGVELLRESGAKVGSCSLSGSSAVCTVTGLTPGKADASRYVAQAVNDVGASARTTPSESTWAYAPPARPTVVATAVKDPTNTSTTEGKFTLSISGSDTAQRFALSINGAQSGDVQRTSSHTIAPGRHTISVVPENTDTPPGYADSAQGSAGSTEVTVGAAPILSGQKLVPDGNRSAKVLYNSDDNFASDVEYTFGISAPGGSSAECGVSSPSFSDLTRFRNYLAVVCAKSSFGRSTVTTGSVWVGGRPDTLTVTSGYVVGATVSESGLSRSWTTIAEQPTFAYLADGATVYFSTDDTGALSYAPVGGGVQAWQCIDGTDYCSNRVNVPSIGASGVTITKRNEECIVSGSTLPSRFEVRGTGPSTPIYTEQGDDVVVSWAGDAWNSTTFANVICASDPPPDSDPAPTP